MNDFFTISHKITLRSVRGTAYDIATVGSLNGKAIATVDTDATIDGFGFSGAADGDNNGAGIQYDASYSIDLPNGGVDTITNNVIEKGANSPNHDATYNLAHNRDIARSGMNPLRHCATYGVFEGRAIYAVTGP